MSSLSLETARRICSDPTTRPSSFAAEQLVAIWPDLLAGHPLYAGDGEHRAILTSIAVLGSLLEVAGRGTSEERQAAQAARAAFTRRLGELERVERRTRTDFS